MANIVHCRICKKEIDKHKSKEEIDWIMPSRNFYYHTECYNKWKRDKENPNAVLDDDLWFDSLKDYLAKDLKMAVDYEKVTSQWKNFIKGGKTAKGIYLTIKYFYEVAHGDIKKSEGGIGIVQYIYSESCKYWNERERREEGICAKIEEQLKQKYEQKIVYVKVRETQKKKIIDLSLIEEEEK